MSRNAPKRLLIVLFMAGISTVSAIDLPWKLSLGHARDTVDSRDAAFTAFSVGEPGNALGWGLPLEEGAIRILVVAPRFTLGDVQELAHRLDVKPEVVAFWDATHVGPPDGVAPVPGTSADETLSRLRELLRKDLDAIVIANVDVTLLPDEDFRVLVDRVRAGAGLVLAHHRKNVSPPYREFLDSLQAAPDAAEVTRGIGDRLAPEWQTGLGFVQASRLGEGRVVELDFPGGRPLSHCLLPALSHPLAAEAVHLDTYLSLVARAVRWAAGRRPEVVIESVEPQALAAPDASEIPVGLATEVEGDALDQARQQLIRPYVVHLREPAPRDYLIRTRLRQPGRDAPVISEYPKTPVRKGETSFRVYTVAGSGEYYLDVWLLDRNKVVDWFTAPVTVDAWPAIESLTLNKPFVLAQDTLGLTFTTPPRPRPFTVLARAVDTLGRTVAETNLHVAPNASTVQVGLDLADLVTSSLKVEVFAANRDVPSLGEWDTQASAFAFSYVPVRLSEDPQGFSLVADIDGSAEYNARKVYRVLAGAGIDAANTAGTEEAVAFLSDADLFPIARIAQYAPERIAQGIIREPCLNDPAWQQSDADRMKAAIQGILYTGSPRVSLGEGNCLAAAGEAVCQSPFTLSAYWEYLRKVYGSLDAVNSSWGTAFASWDTISPPPEEAAVALRAYAPWVDFRLFMDSVFTDTHARARALVRGLDDHARVGLTARPDAGVYTGYDWSKMSAVMDWIAVPLEDLSLDRVRSYRGPESTTGLRVSSALTERIAARARWYPWYAVLHGAQSLCLPQAIGDSERVPTAPLAGPDGTWIPQAPELFAETSELRAGVARLLLGSRRDHSGIAIYASQSSYYLNYLDRSFVSNTPDAERAFISLLTSLGYQYDFLSSEQARSGALGKYKVLILPMARALSDEEAAAIRLFCEKGGGLIADLAPGAYNEHGVPRPAPLLDDLFGVRHLGPSEAAPPDSALVQVDLQGVPVSAAFASVVADQSIEAVDASVGGMAGIAPVWLTRHGDSFMTLINYPLPASDGQDGFDAALGTLFGGVLREAGAQRIVEVSVRGAPVFRGEVVGYTLGEARVIALLADPVGKSQKVRVRLPEAESVYDMRTGTRVARPRNLSVDLAPGAAALYALLPYEVAGLTLEALPEVVAGNRLPFTMQVQATKGPPSTHLVHVELISLLTDEAGPAPGYSRDVLCRDGKGEAFIRLALNERPGVYKLRARDVFTGSVAETMVSVTGRTK